MSNIFQILPNGNMCKGMNRYKGAAEFTEVLKSHTQKMSKKTPQW